MIAPLKVLLLTLGFVNPEDVWWDGLEEHCVAVSSGKDAPWRMRWQMRPISTTHAVWLDNRLREWTDKPLRGRFRALALFVDQGNLRPPAACRAVSGLARILNKAGKLERLAEVAAILAPMLRWKYVDPEWYEENFYFLDTTFPGLVPGSNLLSYLKEAEDGRTA